MTRSRQGLAGPGRATAGVSRGQQGLGWKPPSRHPPLTCTLCRSAARAVLSGLRAGHWVDQHTRAVSMHFVLYNPPTRLFSSVSLHAELLPAEGLTPSLLVESVPVFHSDAAPRYHLLIPQVSSPATRPSTGPLPCPRGVGTGQDDPASLSGWCKCRALGVQCHVGGLELRPRPCPGLTQAAITCASHRLPLRHGIPPPGELKISIRSVAVGYQMPSTHAPPSVMWLLLISFLS